MKLGTLFGKWKRGADDDAIQRERLEGGKSPEDRAVGTEDFEATKDDLVAERRFPGVGATGGDENAV